MKGTDINMLLLPQPKTVNPQKGFFNLNLYTLICIGSDLPQSVRQYAILLKEEIKQDLGFQADIIRTDRKEQPNAIHLLISHTGVHESYQLNVTEKNITLQGADEAGLLYAVQTLRQLLLQYGAAVPAVEIIDEPSIGARGITHDVTRGRVPTLEYLKKLADTCSFYKINQLQLNVEHSYLFQNESEVWRGNTPLCAEEIMELDAYCQSLNIDLVPTLASFGHLYELLRTKTYSHLCELDVHPEDGFSLIDRMQHHTVDVSQEESYLLITSRIREYMGLFSSRYFNICADETFDLGKGKSRILVEKYGVHRAYINFLHKLCDFVISCGKIPMYWGDILVEQPDTLHELPTDSVLLNWEYSPEVKEDNLRKLSQTGAKNIYVCPGVQGWNHLINNHSDAYQNIFKMCQNGHKYHVKGVLNTDWGDLGHVGHPEFSTIGYIYGAAFSWNPEKISEEECNRRISLLQYRDRTCTIVDCFRSLGNQECVGWWQLVQYKEAIQLHHEKLDFSIVLSDRKAKEAAKHITETQHLLAKLYHFLLTADSRTKEVINAYILMAEGQMLLGSLGITILQAKDRKAYEGAENPAALAIRLEKWLMKYKDLWRSVSKESELIRIVEIISWYADYLREL